MLSSPFPHRALWTAVEIDAPVRLINLYSPGRPQSFDDNFNHYATTPLLIDNGKRIYESMVIMDYLDTKFGGGHLHRFDDPFETALVQFVRGKFTEKVFLNFMTQASPNAEEELHASLADYEWVWREQAKEFRAKGPFLLGDKLSAAEIYLMPFYLRCEILFRHFRNGYELLAKYPLLKAALEATKQRPAFQETLSDTDEYYIQAAAHWFGAVP
ncbi:Aste57867_2668 [Aphanomyces stellatus]|uniref:Aste57867_2668 protein n=1 Tax=Aphanomyces stellatus TaxID=120398 RepID=A0A485KDS0_9STRA|nr:hypothetical protein As57867_002661 [Aphanomyces stellatus]VFT79862.1 Aste57867_2668 [Aphanomyces stellatus]